MIICGNCGQANDENATFCSKCNAFLEWTGQHVSTTPGTTGTGPATSDEQQADPRTGPVPGGGAAGAERVLVATLSQGVRSVEPGGQIVFTLDVRNIGTVVDEFTVEVLGDAAAWAEVQPPSLNLMPGTAGVVTIRIRPPRAPQARSGWVNFGVGVRSRQHPQASVVERAAVDVAPFVEYSIELAPRVARGSGGATFAVKARNDGNLPISLSLSADDAEQALEFSFSPPVIHVEPGASRFSSLKVRARQTFLVGAARSRPFQVAVSSRDQPSRTLDGTFVQHGRLPAALLLLTGALAAIAVLGGALLLSGGMGQASPTPPPSILTDATPTIESTESPTQSATESATVPETATPEPTPEITPTPTAPPLTGDAARVISVDPAPGTELSGSQAVTFQFHLEYSLESEAQADLVVSVAQFADTGDQCASSNGSLVVADQVQVDRGSGETTVSVTWPGAQGTGYLAPAPSLWRTGETSRIQYFGVDQSFCYHFSP